MHSTENELIKNEIGKLLEFSSNNSGKYTFPVIEKDIDSYYFDYSSSKHLEEVIVEYNSESVSSLKRRVSALWDDDDCKYAIPIILAAYMKLSSKSTSEAREMDMYNYMM